MNNGTVAIDRLDVGLGQRLEDQQRPVLGPVRPGGSAGAGERDWRRTARVSDVDWPEYLLDRARRAPTSAAVVDGSTPVVSFGHPLRPRVATLGINPSSGEFLNAAGALLAGADRRLATLESLGGLRSYEVDREAARIIVDDCATYFERRPYRWFKPLDAILRAAADASYFEGTACHLDLVQWATVPLWAALDEVTKTRLLAEDRHFLMEQIGHEGYRLIVVNGRTAMRWVEAAGITSWRVTARLAEPPATEVVVGDLGPLRLVGWSCNLQSQAGAMGHAAELARILAEVGTSALDSATARPNFSLPALPLGSHAGSKAELLDLLDRWLTETSDETIGAVDSYGGRSWVTFECPLGLVDINADTRRDAVDAVARALANPERVVLDVIANRRGRLNKVIVSDVGDIVGWYAYLRKPLDQPAQTALS